MLKTELAGMPLGLHASGAAWLPSERTLLVADAHFGKAASFRKLGVPVPHGTTAKSLERLSELIDETGAEQIVFLGDFLHSRHAQASASLAALRRWRDSRRGLALTLVRGNHDDRAGDPPAEWGMSVVDGPLPLGPLALSHYPTPAEGRYVLAGHWHPCVSVAGRGRDHLRLPCFWLGDGAQHPVGVLPAFGQLTGMHPIIRRTKDRVFAAAGDTVRELPP